MNLDLPGLRYSSNETKSIYMNSLTADHDPNLLKLEILTGSNFVSVYSIMTLEFFTLKGQSTGRIEIPAEEVSLTLRTSVVLSSFTLGTKLEIEKS